MVKKVNNIPIYQHPDTLEGQTPVNPEDMPAQFVASAEPTDVISDAPAPEPLSKTDEILKRMYATREPAPILDVEKQNRLRRMGNVNAIGRGVSLLSDALSLGLGGKVKRRAPDQMGPALYQNYQNMLDKYKDQQDQFSFRETANQRNNLRMELADQYKKDADELRREQMDIQAKIAAAKDATERQKWLLQFDQKERDLEARRQEHAATLKLGYSRIAASAKNKTAKEEKPEKPFTIINTDGRDIPLTQGQHRALLEEAIKSKAFKGDDIKTLLAQYVNSPLEGEKNIIQRYASWKAQQVKDEAAKQSANQAANQLIQGSVGNALNPQIPEHARQPEGTVTGPAVGSHAKKKPAYSSLNF